MRVVLLAGLLVAGTSCSHETAADGKGVDREARGSAASVAPGAGGSGSPSEASATKEDPPVAVTTVVLTPQPLDEEVVLTGELRANEEVKLRAEASGRVVDLAFEEGQRVAQGDLLVKINDADLRADLRRGTVERQLAEQRETRTRALLDEKTISQEVYDEARGRLQVLDAELDLIAARIAKTEVHAPFAGVVGLRAVSEGSYLTSDQVVATLQSLDPIKIDFAVPEKYAGRLGAGDQIEFTLAGLEDTFKGGVYAVEPRIDAATRTVQVRAKAPNPQRRLMPGAFAKVRLVLEHREDALLVPSIAIVPGLEATTVFVVENGKAVPRRVRLGQRTADRVQILEGLAPGDEVIVTGVQQLRPGVDVVVK